MKGPQRDLSELSMDELFLLEVQGQGVALTEALLELEGRPADPANLEQAMRAAHSLKGAARLVGKLQAERVAHVMEDVLVAAQEGRTTLDSKRIDTLLRGVDLINTAAAASDPDDAELDASITSYVAALEGKAAAARAEADPPAIDDMAAAFGDNAAPGDNAASGDSAAPGDTASVDAAASADAERPSAQQAERDERGDRLVRVSARHLDQMLALAGEALVTARGFAAMRGELMRLKKINADLTRAVQSLDARNSNDVQTKAALVTEHLDGYRERADQFDRRLTEITNRLYEQVLASRMRPFSDGLQGIRRQTRDLARSLGKDVRLRVVGESTPVDRDVLQRLEVPLTQILRNMIDHGIEPPDERATTGKTPHGTILLEARHNAGTLLVTISDDGRGVDLDRLRAAIVKRGHTTAELVQRMGEEELLAFLFLPGFSMRDQVTHMSGRGVGLDIVQTSIKELGGTVAMRTEAGTGTAFTLQLPITRSVVRAIVFEVAGEAYAVPLSRIERTMRVPRSDVRTIEGREHIALDDGRLGLVAAFEVLGVQAAAPTGDMISVLVLGDAPEQYGLVVDRFVQEQELVVLQLDRHLGKIQDVSAAAILSNGMPALLLDVDDVLRSVHILATGGRISHVADEGRAGAGSGKQVRRVLVVDDSLTVRETERKLLVGAGYHVEVAFDGMDGWNAVRSGTYDLVITDVDMPRMDGIELVTLIRNDARLRTLPVMIVSYKDREEDRKRGLEAGADFYVTKASFHDETLLRAVADLIGGEDE